MITFDEFDLINKEVELAVNETFNYLKNKTINYIPFLANGEFKSKYQNSHLRLNPYVIDTREDKYKDKDRRAFYIQFMETFYSFPNKAATDDNLTKIHMELMVYCHIWESKPFLKQLLKLAISIDNKPYPWNIEIPDMGKHEVIREEIRDVFVKRNLSLGHIITKGFHTSLRNAFAHSEYYFNEATNNIVLDTYTGKGWDIPQISYNDWSKRFAYSVLLSYFFQNVSFENRNALTRTFNTNKFLIMHPIDKNTAKPRYLIYDDHFDTFSFSYT